MNHIQSKMKAAMKTLFWEPDGPQIVLYVFVVGLIAALISWLFGVLPAFTPKGWILLFSLVCVSSLLAGGFWSYLGSGAAPLNRTERLYLIGGLIMIFLVIMLLLLLFKWLFIMPPHGFIK